MKKRLPGEGDIPDLPEIIELDLQASGCCPGLKKKEGGPPEYKGPPIEIKIDLTRMMAEADDAMRCVAIVPPAASKREETQEEALLTNLGRG